MNKIVSWCLFIVAVAAYLTISVSAPWVLSDKNEFLREFVSHEVLGLLGVIVAITLASAANLHLELNKIEDSVKKTFLTGTRARLKSSASWLIGIFAMAFMVVLAKPLLPSNDIATSLVNGSVVIFVLFNILILVDLTQLVFKIQPMFKMLGNDAEKTETKDSENGSQ